MLKQLTDRLAIAFIGFLFGALVGAVLWYLYDHGGSLRRWAPEIHLGIKQWCIYAGAAFAVIGFLFGPGVGSAVGTTSNVVYQYESRHRLFDLDLPVWLLVAVLVVVFLAVKFLVA